jgi:hypothetical protein
VRVNGGVRWIEDQSVEFVGDCYHEFKPNNVSPHNGFLIT